MTTEGNVNLKSTKNEILDAYHELLKKVQEMKKGQRQQEKEAAEKKSLVRLCCINGEGYERKDSLKAA